MSRKPAPTVTLRVGDVHQDCRATATVMTLLLDNDADEREAMRQTVSSLFAPIHPQALVLAGGRCFVLSERDGQAWVEEAPAWLAEVAADESHWNSVHDRQDGLYLVDTLLAPTHRWLYTLPRSRTIVAWGFELADLKLPGRAGTHHDLIRLTRIDAGSHAEYGAAVVSRAPLTAGLRAEIERAITTAQRRRARRLARRSV